MNNILNVLLNIVLNNKLLIVLSPPLIYKYNELKTEINNLNYRYDRLNEKYNRLKDWFNDRKNYEIYLKKYNELEEMKKICSECKKYGNKWVNHKGTEKEEVFDTFGIIRMSIGENPERGKCPEHGDIIGEYYKYDDWLHKFDRTII